MGGTVPGFAAGLLLAFAVRVGLGRDGDFGMGGDFGAGGFCVGLSLDAMIRALSAA